LSTNPGVIRSSGVVSGIVLLSLLWAEASADDTNYRFIPIGAHAIGLGGAFAGVADDSSAAYFNPGGLVLGRTLGFAGGLSINAWDRLEVDRVWEAPDGTVGTTDTQTRTVPIFIGADLRFGPRDVLGEKRFAIALSVVDPIFSRTSVDITLRADPSALSDTYSVDANDRATWYGVSFASRLNLKHSIGGSLYLSVRRLNHQEVGLVLGGGMPVPGQTDVFVGTTTAASKDELGFKTFHLLMRFGWLYRIKPQLQLGVMVQPPGIPIKQTVDVLSQRFINDATDPAAPVTSAYFFDDDGNAKLPLPSEIEAGLEYWPAEKVMLALDASFHAPVRSGERVTISEDAPIGGLFFDNDTKRLATGNAAIGGDFFINEKVRIEAGFFTDLSAAVRIPADPDHYYNARINRFGGTLSLGLNVAGIALAVGSTVLYGKGDATGVIVDGSDLVVDYTRTQASSRTIYLHVTGATRAATELTDMTTESITARREKKKAAEEGYETEPPSGATEPPEAPQDDQAVQNAPP
jgi:hypothetical protein